MMFQSKVSLKYCVEAFYYEKFITNVLQFSVFFQGSSQEATKLLILWIFGYSYYPCL